MVLVGRGHVLRWNFTLAMWTLAHRLQILISVLKFQSLLHLHDLLLFNKELMGQLLVDGGRYCELTHVCELAANILPSVVDL